MTNSIMRRFAVFGGAVYYPSGGLHDFLGSFDTLEEALQLAEKRVRIHPDLDFWDDLCDWWHILDCSTMQCVKRSEHQGYGAPTELPCLDDQ